MIGGLKPHPEMKESGVPSLGAVPAHWEVRRLGQFGHFSKGNGGNKSDETDVGIPCVRYGDLYTTHTHFISDTRSRIPREKTSAYTPIGFGDVLFAASGETIEEIGKSAVNLIRSEAYCGGDVILFRPDRPVDPRYFGYATDCEPAIVQKARMGRGITVYHIYGPQLKRLALPLPPLPEQTAIARFLDHADRRIQRYIRAKEKLIALLEKQTQALILDAVTGRIDVRTGQPYAEYRESNVECLGRVPAHWGVRRLGAMGSVGKGSGGTKEDGVPAGIPCVRYGDLYTTHRYFIRASRSYISPGNLDAYTPIEYGDVLFAASGETIEEIGKSAVNLMHSTACCGGDVILFRPRQPFHAGFMGYASDCPAAATQKAAMGRGVTVMHVYGDQIKRLLLALPPLAEQAAIAHFLDGAMANIDAGAIICGQQIQRIREYRTRLIADVVTGKLDVREAAAKLPDLDRTEDVAAALGTMRAATGANLDGAVAVP